jgi:alkylresorcinol/alkylpyrone synthase
LYGPTESALAPERSDDGIEPGLIRAGRAANDVGSRLVSLTTAVPRYRYTQEEILQALVPRGFSAAQQRLANRVFRRAGVAQRHTVIDLAERIEDLGTGARNERYVHEAVDLGARAAMACLSRAGIDPTGVDELIVVSSSGFELPSLDLRIAGRLGMRPDIRRLSVLGMGCNAAVPALVRAYGAATHRPRRAVLVVAIEIASLHYRPYESLENVIVSALFSDGAAAALVVDDDARPGPCAIDAASYCDYRGFEHITSRLTDHGLRGSMTVEVPEVIERLIGGFVDALLRRNGLARRDVRRWCLHPGGPKILAGVQRSLGLSDDDLESSRAVLRDFGNMSSPTVLFVLDRLQRLAPPATGDIGVLVAFGPGLTLDGILLRW